MSVQSARVQKIVKGDDVVLQHQIMKDVAYDAEASRAPVTVDTGDVVKCFYPLEDSTSQDDVGYLASPIGSLPSSEISVAIPGVIAATLTEPERGTKSLQSGLGRTVRVEITRFSGAKESYYLISEVDIYERGFPTSLDDTSGGVNPPPNPLNLP